jgi:transposase
VVNLDQMGPESAKSFPGQRLVRAEVLAQAAPASMSPPDPTKAARPLDSLGTGAPEPELPKRAERAKQEIDYGRRGKGYIFGAFQPANGEAFTVPYPGRTIANWLDFLEKVDDWIPAEIEHVYGILDNLNVHRATDVLLFSLGRPRWEFVFQPKYAAYLNLIEPWWKVLRSLALKGRRFETWEEVCQAVKDATAYWNAHRHPFVWGRRRRHQPKRRSGVGLLPKVA